MEAQIGFDSGLKLICVVGSGVSHLPFDNTTHILCGVQVRPVSWPSNTMVSTPVTTSFASGLCLSLGSVWTVWHPARLLLTVSLCLYRLCLDCVAY